MIERLANWWRGQREWNRIHRSTFAIVSVPDSDGITLFQRQLMAAVAQWIPPDTFQRKAGDVGTYFVADVPRTKMKLYVYPIEAELSNVPKQSIFSGDSWTFEEWDFRTPEDLIAAIVQEVRNAV